MNMRQFIFTLFIFGLGLFWVAVVLEFSKNGMTPEVMAGGFAALSVFAALVILIGDLKRWMR